MGNLTRRSVLRGSLGLAAAGSLARPYIANAAATTATVWWAQGFAEEEDISFKKIVTEYEKASGNTIDYSIMPYAPLRQKIVSAVTSGVVPDLFQNNPAETIALYAWQDKLVDVSDVVETQREEYTETALLTVRCYNNVEKKRSIYGVPYTVGASMNHIWRPLVEKAGYQMSDIPKTWDAFYDFFKEVQKKLRAQGMRNVYGLGFQLAAIGGDSNARFNDFVIAYGGRDIVTKDGKLHLDDPKVRKAAIEALTYPTTAYKEGFVPPGAINWNDFDDNNAFHGKQIVMDIEGSLSTEVADLQPGLCPGPERAYLAGGLGRDHEGRCDTAGGGREGVQAGRGDLREIPDCAELRGSYSARRWCSRPAMTRDVVEPAPNTIPCWAKPYQPDMAEIQSDSMACSGTTAVSTDRYSADRFGA